MGMLCGSGQNNEPAKSESGTRWREFPADRIRRKPVMPIHQYPKPDLSGYEIRQIAVPKSKHQLEGALVPWISEVVRRLKQPSSPRYTAKFLVEAAPGKDEILSAPPGLSLGRGNVQKIRAKFNLINGNHNGSWYLRSVEFSPELCDARAT
jgi:hypothetical protein